MKSVCIVTEELAGITRSGGIGACARGLALHLSSLGYYVDVLITNLDFNLSQHMDPSISKWNLISLKELASLDKEVEAPVDDITKSYCVYRYLRTNSYVTVHFNDWLGSGFYTAMARRQGLFRARVISHLHGSSEWVRRHNLALAPLEDFAREAIERSQIENSDCVISPSQYLLDWYRQQAFNLPEAHVMNWLLPQWLEDPSLRRDTALESRGIEPGAIDELIFFGRHERRKGFEIFVDAVAALPNSFQPNMTFIGRFDRIDREFTGSYVFRKLKDYAGKIDFVSNAGQVHALNLIRRSTNALCVMPSLVENSPCVVGECLTIGVPFLASEVGGTAELIHPESRGACLVSPTAKALSKAILRVAESGMPPIRSALVPDAIRNKWSSYHDKISVAPEPVVLKKHPLVSVCFTHYNRPAHLNRALQAIFGQTYSNIEIVIVDDGSTLQAADAFLRALETKESRFPLKVIRSENRYLGAARNLAANHAKGDYLLFHDDDNFAEPIEVETFVKAALNSNADVLTSQYFFFRDGQEDKTNKKMLYYPIGIGGPFSFFTNKFGDANALIRRSTFEKIGGFTELHGVGWEDWEFFLKAYLLGYRMGVVPEPLFNYRTSQDGMLATGNVARNIERIFDAVDTLNPRMGADVLRLANHEALAQNILDTTWQRLKREPLSQLHHELTAIDPNSDEAREKLSDLAFALGRSDDAIRIGLQIQSQREKLLHLVKSTNKPRKVNVQILHPTDHRDALFIRGWSVSGRNPLKFDRLNLKGHRYDVLASERYRRPDIKAHFGLDTDIDLGFNLFANNPRKLSDVMERLRGRTCTMPVTGQTNIHEISVPVGDKGTAGHIDHLSWYRYFELKDIDKNHDCFIEVETSAPSHSAIMWSSEVIEFGERLSDTRVRFLKSAAQLVAFPILIIPNDLRCDIMVS